MGTESGIHILRIRGRDWLREPKGAVVAIPDEADALNAAPAKLSAPVVKRAWDQCASTATRFGKVSAGFVGPSAAEDPAPHLSATRWPPNSAHLPAGSTGLTISFEPTADRAPQEVGDHV